MRTLVLFIALTTIGPTAVCQTARPTDPETRFKQNAAVVVAAEKSREKLTPCLNQHAADREVTCPQDKLDLELDRSNKNYPQLTRAVGGLLRLYREGGKDTAAAQDRSNTEAIGKDFDAAESAWAKYSDAECETISEDLHGGMMTGHPWLYEETSCKLVVTHQHIYELNAVYGWLWNR